MPVAKLLLALALAPVAQALNLCDAPLITDADDKCFGKDTNPCDTDCGCLMRVGQAADPDAQVPKLAWGVPGIRPISPALQGCVRHQLPGDLSFYPSLVGETHTLFAVCKPGPS